MTSGTPGLLLIALIGGVAIALQGKFMGSMDRASGTATSIFVTYLVGFSLALTFWLARRDPVTNMRAIPWYSWFSGALGLIIVGGIGYATPRLGLSRTLIVSVAAQLLTAVIIDHFGLFGAAQRPFDVNRAAGLALTVAGVWMIVKS